MSCRILWRETRLRCTIFYECCIEDSFLWHCIQFNDTMCHCQKMIYRIKRSNSIKVCDGHLLIGAQNPSRHPSVSHSGGGPVAKKGSHSPDKYFPSYSLWSASQPAKLKILHSQSTLYVWMAAWLLSLSSLGFRANICMHRSTDSEGILLKHSCSSTS